MSLRSAARYFALDDAVARYRAIYERLEVLRG